MIATAPALPTFDVPVRHPAKFSPDLLRVMSRYLKAGWLVYDPFGGVGGLHRIASATGAKTVCGEIEPRVIANARGTRSIAANAMYLPFGDETFDAISTSPTYGNRMSDVYPNWKPDRDDRTYSHSFGFTLHPENSGTMNWGTKYRALHESAWGEAFRILNPGGLFLLNISDHIRAGRRIYVSAWHLNTLRVLGLRLLKTHAIKTPRITYGSNWDLRCSVEYIFVLQKKGS